MTDGSAFRLLHVTKFTDKKDSRLVVLYVAKVSSILTVRCYKTIRRRQSARMSKITNDGLTQSGNIWHMTHMTTVGVKGRSSVRLVVFVCRVTDVWFFPFRNIQQLALDRIVGPFLSSLFITA